MDETPLPITDDLQNGANDQFELHSQVSIFFFFVNLNNIPPSLSLFV